ncbi:MAG: hypothetical protein H0W40_07685 [Methylibium sp.]|uniref:hypothetical protein n=1 Tax=Methylibium sp. TaxID=2067992 RepID=UPI0018142308|nr:hypothetical protein [Methylibium sp.]MBA3597243.1 hypothetical protein [Methylibium sp.]
MTTVDALVGQLPQQKPVQVSANGQFEGEPYRLEASAGPLQRLQDDATPYPVKLTSIWRQYRRTPKERLLRR